MSVNKLFSLIILNHSTFTHFLGGLMLYAMECDDIMVLKIDKIHNICPKNAFIKFNKRDFKKQGARFEPATHSFN